MDIFLARQAIYDSSYKSVAYELLYRNSKENKFEVGVDEDKATMKLISNCVAIGLSELTNGKTAFINFTNGLILKEFPTILPKDKVVIEILETVKPTEEILTALGKLKESGYVLALDDVVGESRYWEFGKLIDIYKKDFRATTKRQRFELVQGIRILNPDAQLLAEKIESKEEYDETQRDGYSYFQGFYFSKPLMMAGKDVPVRNNTCFNIMSQLMNNDFDINEIEAIIKSDVAISYKLMRLLNSASFSFVQRISSIKQAIMLIGKKELNKWLTVITMSEMQSSNEQEVTTSTIIRARFCELIADKVVPKKKSQCFMVGLFSNLDIYMQKDMNLIVDELPIDDELKDALLGEKNEISLILELVEAYEAVDEQKISAITKQLNIGEGILVNLYLESINWEKKLMDESKCIE